MKQPHTLPGDIATALALAISPGQKLAELAEGTAKSIGETHNAIRRLGQADLLEPGARSTAVEPLIQFIHWGLPFAFPALLGGPAIGIPTAAMPLAEPAGPATSGGETVGLSEFVWPWASGPASGTALIPLYPAAPRLAAVNRPLFELLVLVDLVRVGGARERDAAIADIRRRITRASA